MSPTPFTFLAPSAPAAYAWEATDEEVAARYGLAIEDVVRFDLNTSPAPPDLIGDLLASGRFETPLSEYPPADYRRLTEAAAARFGVGTDEVLIGAGADEILDIIGKVFLPVGSRAVVPIPTYAMYRVITEQRGATVIPVPRLGALDGYRLDVAGRPGRGARCGRRVAVQPQQPDGLAGTRRCDRGPALRPRRRCRGDRSQRADRRPRRGLRRIRRLVARSNCERPIRGSSSSGPPARPTPWRACASGSGSRGRTSSPS